jgi:hypothetical protein
MRTRPAIGTCTTLTLIACLSACAGSPGVGGFAEDDGGRAADEASTMQHVGAGSVGADGSAGLNTLVSVSAVAPGTPCAAGGYRIDIGVDLDRSTTLDESEIETSEFVCHGEDGQDGADGFTALVRVTIVEPGAECAAGGQRVESGLDDGAGDGTAGDGVLHDDEVTSAVTVCFGAGGGIRVYDANDLDLGRFVMASSYFGSDVSMLTDAGYLYSLRYYDLTVAPQSIWYSGQDCTGSPFAAFGGGGGSLLAHSDSFVANTGTALYRSVPGTGAARAYKSWGVNGGCWNGTGTASNSFEVVQATKADVGLAALSFQAPLRVE